MKQLCWPARFIRNFCRYRKRHPRLGVRAALRWAWEDPELPLLARR